MLPNIVDGFSYNTTLEELPLRWEPMALAQLETLRRAANYRAHWYVVPDDVAHQIDPFDTFYYQVRAAGGSYLWGYRFAVMPVPNQEQAPPSPGNLLIQVTDSCTGIPLFQDFINAAGAAVNSRNAADFGARVNPIILTQPRLVLEPGLINVEIANRTGNSLLCQLILMLAEPCRLITEETRELEWQSISARR